MFSFFPDDSFDMCLWSSLPMPITIAKDINFLNLFRFRSIWMHCRFFCLFSHSLTQLYCFVLFLDTILLLVFFFLLHRSLFVSIFVYNLGVFFLFHIFVWANRRLLVHNAILESLFFIVLPFPSDNFSPIYVAIGKILHLVAENWCSLGIRTKQIEIDTFFPSRS